MAALGRGLRRHLVALRVLLVLSVLCGIAYPLAVLGVAQIPGLRSRADGSLLRSADGTVVGSRQLGQLYEDPSGSPLPQYFQGRPSAAGDGYDPSASGASNLGPEDVVDTLPDPTVPGSGRQSLLTQVCARSLAIGAFEGVSGARPFCTASGVGAVLSVIHARGTQGPVVRVVSVNEACPARPFVVTWDGIPVSCAGPGDAVAGGVITPVRGDAPATPAVPADAVTASGSGLDPDISPAYARLQEVRVARARGIPLTVVAGIVDRHTRGRFGGFIGEPTVNVLAVNRELDALFPSKAGS